MMKALAKMYRESITFALSHRAEALAYAKGFGRGLDDDLNDRFVGMYVNELTLDYGERGRKSIALFLERAHARGYLERPTQVEFIS
jgi:1,4-dihydroxy-6-naphthoate synthase